MGDNEKSVVWFDAVTGRRESRAVDQAELGEIEAAGMKAELPAAVVGRSTREELTYRLGEWLRGTPAEDRACGMCGCSEALGCAAESGRSCFWTAPGLCSACAVRLGALVWQGLKIGDLSL